jgi:hypothetical protein
MDDFRTAFMPYCLKRRADGNYVALNRHYKPVGTVTTDWVNYEDYPAIPGRHVTAKLAVKLSHKGSPDLDCIYLYDDGCIPTDSAKAMNSYLQRLPLLAKLKVIGIKPK